MRDIRRNVYKHMPENVRRERIYCLVLRMETESIGGVCTIKKKRAVIFIVPARIVPRPLLEI